MSLYEYQEQGAAFLSSLSRAFLCDEPGLGKTVQALVAADWSPTLVVCPASVKDVWVQEVMKFTYSTPVLISKRGELRAPNYGEVVICNPELLALIPFDGVLILDEAHMYKNPTAKRTKLVRSLAASSTHTWALTGTPILKDPLDLWGLACTLGIERSAFGSFQLFVKLFRGHRTRFGWKFGNPTPDALRYFNQYVLRRTRSEVLPQLPTKTYRTVQVPGKLPVTDPEGVEQMVDMPSGGIHLATWRKELANFKSRFALTFVKDAVEGGDRLVVFSAHTEPLTALAALGYPVITGSTPIPERKAAVERFQAGQVPVIAGTIAAMGVGLTLTSAHHVLFIDRDWTPALNQQAEDRVCRIGQTRGVIVTDLVSKSRADKLVTDALLRKQRLLEQTGFAAQETEQWTLNIPAR